MGELNHSEDASRLSIQVNGEDRSFLSGTTVAQVVSGTSPAPRGIAVALNGEVLSRSLWPKTEVRQDDRIEVLTVAPGG